MDADAVPKIPLPVKPETAILFNWIFTGAIIFGNLVVILLIIGSERLRTSPKYILVASLAFADLSDGGCFLPMWTDILMNLQVQFSCQARYIAGALGYSIASVSSLSVVAINTDFTFRRSFTKYKGRVRCLLITILLLLCWVGPIVALEPFVASGIRGSQPVHCYFTLDQRSVTFFMCLAFFIPSGAIAISTGFVIFVHRMTKQGACRVSATPDTSFPLDIVTSACLTLVSYLSFAVLQLQTYHCRPQDCYSSFLSSFLVIGNIVYAKFAILPWIWLCSRRFREEVKDMFFVSSPSSHNTQRNQIRQY